MDRWRACPIADNMLYRCNEIVGADVIFVRASTRISNDFGSESAL